MTRRALPLVVAAVAAVLGSPVGGQAPGLALRAPSAPTAPQALVLGDSIRVGDVVPVAVRVVVGPDERVVLPPVLPLDGDDVENVARVRERVDTLADGSLQVTAVYSVTGWRPGITALPPLAIDIVAADGRSRSVTAQVPPLEVVSILPADPDLLEPMPAKGVLGPSFAWWPFLLLVLLVLALVGLLLWWRRRRRPAAAVVSPALAVHPRDRALAALRHARDAGFIEAGQWKEFYSRVTHAVRVYLESLHPDWSEDLTSTEIVARVRERAGVDAAASLAALLRPADQVKFARRVPDPASAETEWAAACRWVETFDGPPAPAPLEVAA